MSSFRAAVRSAVLVGAILPATLGAAPFTARDNMALKRASDPQASPDGSRVIFVVKTADIATNSTTSDLWIVPTAGGEPRPLTTHPAADTHPRWSPDGRRVAFLSDRGEQTQAFLLNLGGGEARRATSFAGGVESVTWIDNERLLVGARVFPACGADETCDAERRAETPSTPRVYDELLYRHWDTWDDGRRVHLFAVALDGSLATDLTPGPDDVPPFNVSGPPGFDVSPDGQEVCFTRREARTRAWSTNGDVWVVPSTGGQPERVTDTPGDDGGCQYSPDGRFLVWRMQERGGYESDRWQLVARDRQTGATRAITADFDRHVESFTFSPDGRTIYLIAPDQGRENVFSVSVAGGGVRPVLRGGSLGDLAVLPDGQTIVGTWSSHTHPKELVRFLVNGQGLTRITQLNDAFLAPFSLRSSESVTYTGAGGQRIQAWLVKPPDFEPTQKYPLLVLIHGGPQGAWSDAWSYRWNPQVFASAGYVVFMPNPTGSIGWGQSFTDAIRNDWGGRVYEDVMRGTDSAEALPYVEKGRTVAAGASFGGYMANWIAGHTDRFRALVSHDGVFDLKAFYGATEELWFPEWEFEGTSWERPEGYARWDPSAHVESFQTPMLVIHGEKDYRVPLEQSLALFTALRRQDVPARLLVFPDENHWVLEPANSLRWHDEVLGWLDRWSKAE